MNLQQGSYYLAILKTNTGQYQCIVQGSCNGIYVLDSELKSSCNMNYSAWKDDFKLQITIFPTDFYRIKEEWKQREHKRKYGFIQENELVQVWNEIDGIHYTVLVTKVNKDFFSGYTIESDSQLRRHCVALQFKDTKELSDEGKLMPWLLLDSKS